MPTRLISVILLIKCIHQTIDDCWSAEHFNCLDIIDTNSTSSKAKDYHHRGPPKELVKGTISLTKIKAGDIFTGQNVILQDGRMGESIYGQRMRDEKFLYRLDQRGLLAMSHGGQRHTGNSQVLTYNFML